MLRDLGWSNAIRIVIGHRPSRITHAFRSIWLYSTTRSAAIVLATVTGDCKEGIGATRGTGRNSHVGAPISHTSHNCTVPSFVHHRLSPFCHRFSLPHPHLSRSLSDTSTSGARHLRTNQQRSRP